MEIVSYGADNAHSLWVIVASEMPLDLGEHSVFKIDKIDLDHACITKTKTENEYKIYFASMTVGDETYLHIHKIGDLFRAHFMSDFFKDARTQPSDFIKELVNQIKGWDNMKEHIVTCEYSGSILRIKIIDPEGKVSVYENTTTDAYMDYLLFGKLRAHFVTTDGKRGTFGTEEIQAYVEDLNRKLQQAADAVQVDFGYAYYTGEVFRLVAGMKNGRAVEVAVPMGILIHLVEFERELIWDISRTEDTFGLAIDWEEHGLPRSYLTAWQHPDWNVLRHIGQVK